MLGDERLRRLRRSAEGPSRGPESSATISAGPRRPGGRQRARTSSSDRCTLSRNDVDCAFASCPSGRVGRHRGAQLVDQASSSRRAALDRRLDGRSASRPGVGDRVGRVGGDRLDLASSTSRCSCTPRRPMLSSALVSAASAARRTASRSTRSDEGAELHAREISYAAPGRRPEQRDRRAGVREQGEHRRESQRMPHRGPFDAYDLHSSAMAAVEEPTTLEWDAPLWRTALAQFEQALEHADISPSVAERLRYPERRRGRLRADPSRLGRRGRASRVPRAALDGARPDEGWHPLRPARLARRVRGARDVDDLEVRAAAPAVRRREGRRPLQPARHVASARSNG